MSDESTSGRRSVDERPWFQLLGTVQVRAGDRELAVGSPHQGAVLAALLVDAGQVVGVDTLVDRVWGPDAPERARRTLHTYVTRIRRLLESAAGPDGAVPRVVRWGEGYRLDVDRDRVDVHRFRALVASDDPDVLKEALALWRGQPLAGLGGPWADRLRHAWVQRRLDATTAWGWAELRRGEPTTVIGPLTELADEHPLAESVTAVLMRALHDAGRTADALDRYATLRRRLVEELGGDPGPEVRDLHTTILRGQTSDRAADPPRAGRERPAQLPIPVAGFVGREVEIAALDELIPAAERSATIGVVSGTAGVGKTALAVHWAHRAADRFPDGQLYVNLRGFDPTGSRLDPADAIRGFLDALGVPPARIPPTVEAQAARYRGLLASARMLIVLDNAADADQVRPLLPGGKGNLVLITSRDQLGGLVAVEGARPIGLGLPGPDDARRLLTGRWGAARTAAEPDAVDDIIEYCARLPLALAVVAARATVHPGFPLAALAGELRDAGRLDALATTADPGTDPRAVLSWSYRALSVPAARLFRLLGLHPTPEVGVPAAASLAGVPVAVARQLLAELARAHLLTEYLPGRFSSHDLLRAYAAELVHAEEDEDARHAAGYRLLDHYLYSASAVAALLPPTRDAVAPLPRADGVTVVEPSDQEAGLAWFATEWHAVLASVEWAAEAGYDEHVWRLARTLDNYFERCGYWRELLTAHQAALAAANRLDDRAAVAAVSRGLGIANLRLNQLDAAITWYRRGLGLAEELGDELAQARASLGLVWAHAYRDEYRQALPHARRTLRHFESAGHDGGQAYALSALSWILGHLDQLEEALTYAQRALAGHEKNEDLSGQAEAWDGIGHIKLTVGDAAGAVVCYHHAFDMCQALGDRFGEADVLTHLGEAYQATGDRAATRGAWTRALSILDELEHPSAGSLRARLANLDE